MSAAHPAVSGVMPAFNPRGGVRVTVEPVGDVARLTPRFGIIVVDDGSSDGTAAAVADLPPDPS